MQYVFYNEDCISGSQKHLKNNSIDMLICDPPYGIQGDTLDKHYNRNEDNVLEGYVEIPKEKYAEFSRSWITEADRVLRPGGSIYIVSRYSNLADILIALRNTSLVERNHIIWKYNFGVHTTKKFVSSHYHILYYTKGLKNITFNTNCRYADFESNSNNGSLNYLDREDVWVINREYKPGKIKNKNELPTELLIKMIQYSSNEGDIVGDFFLGSFSTARVAKGLNRNALGFEINPNAFNFQLEQINELQSGYLLDSLRRVPENKFVNTGKPISIHERKQIIETYNSLISNSQSKKQVINYLSDKFGRGSWSLQNIIKEYSGNSPEIVVDSLFEDLY